jgi:long-chain acyl-CoA synthetase
LLASTKAEALQCNEITRALLARIGARIKEFPGYAQVRRCVATLDPWTIENGLLTPTMKLRRARVMEKYQAELDHMYFGH